MRVGPVQVATDGAHVIDEGVMDTIYDLGAGISAEDLSDVAKSEVLVCCAHAYGSIQHVCTPECSGCCTSQMAGWELAD